MRRSAKPRMYLTEANANRRMAHVLALHPDREFCVVPDPFGYFRWTVAMVQDGGRLAYCS